ncbi:MAG: tRNA preQ1(34) S-adenosylmethionine ribosyltransferase-isomerase QueA [Nitrospirae bacterium]|nr:tRNA preQ1(34) S-adenosylmethionine ribosyltransferase-isomerase QueA [Nitrospirota bacterium]MBI3352658.1 tRNA preQ1(34) S-adenosylmethionine ribosyltransferase-isomerase QueA [Nitrospirota bacterium]
MKLSDFDYPIQNHTIAQYPPPVRDQARLLVLNRATGEMAHRHFSNLAELLEPGQVLVLNDTKVFPARLTGHRETGARTEIFLLHPRSSFQWEALSRGKFRKFHKVHLKGGLEGRFIEDLGEGKALIEFKEEETSVKNHFLKHGEVPLPPYIRRENGLQTEDRENYQTVYAKAYGSVAAPTAGLHFTPSLLDKLGRKGVEIVTLTLHVGLGTFKPVHCEEIEQHKMENEFYSVSEESAKKLRSAKAENRKVIAVGTTTTRTLETISTQKGEIVSGRGYTEFFIFPGYLFKAVDGLITNFHLPRTTLLMLVSAFAGRELVLQAYETALKENYRFYSYGDAMFIL